MLDVFVMSVLVALVKLGELATLVAGPGLFSFMAVAVLTILASSSFDPQLIWEIGDARAVRSVGRRGVGAPPAEARL